MAIEIKKILSVQLFAAFYGFAGIMHFVIPSIYITVIPEGLGDPLLLNYAAGVVELAVAGMAVVYKTRKIAGYVTIAMLLAFVISHVYFIQLEGCAGDLCLPEWVGWLRLIIIHPLLIYWAWSITKTDIEAP
jgi:uncharacterized membrane protein